MPTGVEPVNEIARIAGLTTSSSPTVLPGPVRKFSTPAGRPASSSASTKYAAVRGVRLAGLSTIVLPPISAGTHLRQITLKGKFQGLITLTTPIGWRIE